MTFTEVNIMESDEIKKIREKFQERKNWPQFLESIKISGIRGWTGETVEFRFPIVAIAGENGSGKSTILRAAASAYKNKDELATYYPGIFFMDTHWEKIQGVTLTYLIRNWEKYREVKITRVTSRWRFPSSKSRPERFVWFSDISRLLPLDATIGYAKIAKLTAREASSEEITNEYRSWYSFTLGHKYSKARFAKSDVNTDYEVGILEREFGEMSQFHQGTGEATVLDLFKIFQIIPDYSLLIIDEIESSLHPKAQRRLIRFLLYLCRQKKLQIILSTHSPYILKELPREARVLLMPGTSEINVLYGITSEFALSRLDEKDHTELYIFTEDRESKIWLREIISTLEDCSGVLSRISINGVGPANAVQLLGRLSHERKLPYNSLSVVDGDMDESPGCIKLPGSESPEKVIFKDLKVLNWPNLPERFGIGAGTLYSYLEEAILDPDPHNWSKNVGDKVRKSANSVWEILSKEWCDNCLAPIERDRITQKIIEALPIN
ncbi:ATP-dependent nuclease [Methanosphaerula subterraneus]|uniref:ATP-dependent nuclease n=1 Tax=Methanosphaerula subterraneus TaxID=3350244 RepID=UPI003F87805A